jgi:hypothetical protein
LFYKTFAKNRREIFIFEEMSSLLYCPPGSLLPIYCYLKKILEVFLKVLPTNGKSTLQCLPASPTSEIWKKKKV